jgi:hypothetical protein
MKYSFSLKEGLKSLAIYWTFAFAVMGLFWFIHEARTDGHGLFWAIFDTLIFFSVGAFKRKTV